MAIMPAPAISCAGWRWAQWVRYDSSPTPAPDALGEGKIEAARAAALGESTDETCRAGKRALRGVGAARVRPPISLLLEIPHELEHQ